MHRERSVAPWLSSPWLSSPWLLSPLVLNTGWVGGLGLPAAVVMGNEGSLHALVTKKKNVARKNEKCCQEKNVARRRMLPGEECCQEKNVARRRMLPGEKNIVVRKNNVVEKC